MSTARDYIETSTAKKARRFVVLFHAHPGDGDHFDLMIEQTRVLRTWRLAQPPENATNTEGIACLKIGDHRLDYLEYEGPVSGNRGHVTRHDEGRCVIVKESGDRVVLEFAGRKANGQFVMVRDADAPLQWRLFRA